MNIFVNVQKQKLLSQDKQSSEKEVKISTGGHVESESMENIHLDLKASDQGFIDTLVNTLKFLLLYINKSLCSGGHGATT
jgi:hypothetical protein